jgi:hypothetical protein
LPPLWRAVNPAARPRRPAHRRANRSPAGLTPDWRFPPSEDSGVAYSIQVEETTFPRWSLALGPDAEATIRDTDALNLLLSVGWTWSGADVELRDIKGGYVNDQTWEADGAVLRLVSTQVNKWYPNAGGNGRLTLLDSTVNEIEPWGEARVIIRNSRLSVIHATNKAEVWVYDSFIDYDVVAFDQGVIRLFNTEVSGQITATDDGEVYVDGELQ